MGTYLLKMLGKLKDKHMIIGDVRGSGLFIGVELVKSRLTLSLLRMRPPIFVTD
ncbi:MAG: hypothetical protein R2727_05485 [Bacteroidales bacterium]